MTSRMIPFVEPQGNFGSLDDPPAAARYTECRLSYAAMDMVRELDEDTVDFRPTYDGEGEEPVVLPAALPNLLALNFILNDSLGGSGSASLKTDAQGKTHAMAMLRMRVEVPDDYEPPQAGAGSTVAPGGEMRVEEA